MAAISTEALLVYRISRREKVHNIVYAIYVTIGYHWQEGPGRARKDV